MKKIIKQILKFGIVGFTAFLIDYFLFESLTTFLKVPWFFSSIISFVVSLIINYILSIKWVFEVKKKQTIKEVSLFVMLSIIGLLINQLVLYLMIDVKLIKFIPKQYLLFVSKIAATTVVMIWNFITRKIFIEK